MTPEELRRDAEALSEALGGEWYRAGAGLTTDPQFATIYERFAHLGAPSAVAAARVAGSTSLLEWAADFRVGRAVADLDEAQQRWEQTTVVELDDGSTLSYQRVPIELANTPNRDRRRAIDAARTARLSEVADLCRERFRRERAILAEVTPEADAVAARASLSGIDLDGLTEAGARFLAETDDLYREVLFDFASRRVDASPTDLARYDIAYLFRAERYDAAFDGAQMVAIARAQVGEMGLDAECGGRVRFDTVERPGKSPRAFMAPVRVPDEVYLVLRPQGGHGDYRTFWHELGHAMHFASVDADRVYEERWLGDNSVTEAYAMLCDHLTLDQGWLKRYAGLSREDAETLARDAFVEELFFVRRYAAKIAYECELYRAGVDADMGACYADHLTRATGFRYGPEDALVDVDPGFYAARYLRAWQLEAALHRVFVDRYDADWYRNPRAGPELGALLARGQADPADRLAAQVTDAPLTFDAVRRRLEAHFT